MHEITEEYISTGSVFKPFRSHHILQRKKTKKNKQKKNLFGFLRPEKWHVYFAYIVVHIDYGQPALWTVILLLFHISLLVFTLSIFFSETKTDFSLLFNNRIKKNRDCFTVCRFFDGECFICGGLRFFSYFSMFGDHIFLMGFDRSTSFPEVGDEILSDNWIYHLVFGETTVE